VGRKFVSLYIVEKALNGIAVLDLRGRITLGDETANLRQMVNDLLNSGRKQIVLNLKGVNYIDSSGLSTLIACFISSRKQGGSLKLAHLTTRVRDLMQITRLSTVFESYETVEDAKNSFDQRAPA
jgi:anti-sigma B factor antagonist